MSTHILCHSLLWREVHEQRCKIILRALQQVSILREATIYMLGGILHKKATLHDVYNLKRFLKQLRLTFHVIPHEDRDIWIATLLDLPCHVDVHVDDTWMGYTRVEYATRMYKAETDQDLVYSRDQTTALIPTRAKDFRYVRYLLLTTPTSVERLPFPHGPRVFDWHALKDPLHQVQGGDMVRVWYPTPRHMERIRSMKRNGVRVRILSTRSRRLPDFWHIFNEVMRDSPARGNVHKMLRALIYEDVNVSFTSLHVHRFHDIRDWLLDLTGQGIVKVIGSNASGKHAMFVHIWCWVLLGIWRGKRAAHTIGPDTHISLCGFAKNRCWMLERRVTSHTHVLRLTIDGEDHTQEDPYNTSMYFHRSLLHWDVPLSTVYRKWVQLLVLEPSSQSISCPHVDTLRDLEDSIESTIERMRGNLHTNKTLLKHSQITLKNMRANIEKCKGCLKTWEAWRSELLECLAREERTDAGHPIPECSDGREEQQRVDELMDRVEELRQAYFAAIRERRALDNPTLMYHNHKIMKELRKRVDHAEQEQEARKTQECSISMRVNMHINVESARRAYDDALKHVMHLHREAQVAMTNQELLRLSGEITVVSEELTRAKDAFLEWEKKRTLVEEMQRSQERRREIRCRMNMLKEDRSPVLHRLRQMEQLVALHQPQVYRLAMYCEELEQRLAVASDSMRVKTIRTRWIHEWMTHLDERATFLWHVAGWDDRVSFHGGRMYREGSIQHASRGEDVRCTCVFFLAHREVRSQVPCFTLKDVDIFLDEPGKRGLTKLVRYWCDQNARRTCWWISRDTEGDINMDGV